MDCYLPAMQLLSRILLLSSLGALVSCALPDSPDVGNTARAGTDWLAKAETKYYKPKSGCPSYACGLNSPFIGHELNLSGKANQDAVRFVGAHHLDHGSVDVEVQGDELVAHVGGAELRGEELVGLTLDLEGEVEGQVLPISVKLVEVALVDMWARNPARHEPQVPMVPSYKFVYASPGIDNQLLCPSATEGAAEDPAGVSLAKEQVELFDAGRLDELERLNAELTSKNRSFHTVLFVGERFDYETAEIYEHDARDWVNWGCAGSSAAKLHLTGHTSAGNQRVGASEPLTPKLQQAMLYAYTATYCPGAPRMTVPGHPIRIAEVRGVLPRDGAVSFAPRAAGKVEALWGPDGVQCLSTPRLEASGHSVWTEIKEACGDAIPACPERDALSLADEAGTMLDDSIPVATLNLASDSCQNRCGTAGETWDCSPGCGLAGTCSSDYAALCP